MKTHRFASHALQEKRRLSNLGHIVEGLLLGTVGVLALLASIGIASWTATAWAILILVAGLLLLLLIYPRHPLDDWPAIWRDAQQRQHTIMATAIALAGAAELLKGVFAPLVYVWPLVMLIIGGLFLTHAQHGTGEAVVKAVWQHRLLGITVIVAGLLRAAEIASGLSLWAILWPLVLLTAAAQLIMYREPEGAFEPQGGHGAH